MTELIKTAMGSLENNETENQLALNAFNLAALNRAGSEAMFEVGFWRVVLCRCLPCFSFSQVQILSAEENGDVRKRILCPFALC